MAKKKKLQVEALEGDVNQDKTDIATGDGSLIAVEKEKKKKKRKKRENDSDEMSIAPRTVSIAIDGSIIDNTQSFELATRFMGCKSNTWSGTTRSRHILTLALVATSSRLRRRSFGYERRSLIVQAARFSSRSSTTWRFSLPIRRTISSL